MRVLSVILLNSCICAYFLLPLQAFCYAWCSTAIFTRGDTVIRNTPKELTIKE